MLSKRKNLVAAGALAGAVLLLSGCRLNVDFGDRKQSVATYTVGGGVTALEAYAEVGDIVISESGQQEVRVTETRHWGGDDRNSPKTEHPVAGGTLTLRYDCPGSSNCSVDYRIDIPKGLAVTLESTAGDITMRSLTGEVNASAGAGDIEGNDLGGKSLVATTGAGEVRVRFAAAPGRVEVETGTGDATVRLPQGSYNVTAGTGVGEEVVKVTNDPASPNGVSVRTGAGDAKVLPV
ncbi:DUF4097 family beta strand repeat-containing protein [Streptosporangium sp. NPDC000239]|uniref:DUF4097 family beta strand repeat-containing protein n=1 Tax=Streptosporangium sp. NPDC000239 TaxID=3154248 RepID=UPI0033296E91